MTTNSLNTQMPVYQVISSKTNSVVTCNGSLPRDDTIPQNTEGTEILTVTLTPRSSTSKLFIEFFAPLGVDSYTSAANIALFQDATADALSAASFRYSYMIYFNHFITSGTESSTTFKIRIGYPTVVGTYINGDDAGNRIMGGVSNAYMKVTEYLIE